MKRIIAGLIALCFVLCIIPPLYGADEANESEATAQIEATGSPYPPAPPPRPDADVMILDFLLVRPLSFAGLVIGTGLAFAATPLALASGSTHEVYRRLVVQPYDFTVCRPLGQF